MKNMLKFEKIVHLDALNIPFSNAYSLIFSDLELDKTKKETVESYIKEFNPIFVKFNPDKSMIEYVEDIPYIIVTIQIIEFPPISVNELIDEVKDNFIEYYGSLTKK